MAKKQSDLLGSLVNEEIVYGTNADPNDPYAGMSLDEYLGVAIPVFDGIDLLSEMKLDLDENADFDEFKDAFKGKASNVKAIFTKNSSVSSTGIIQLPKFKCPQCGKELDMIPKTGFCSTACAMKFLMSNIISFSSKQDKEANDISKKLQLAIDFINIIINLSATLPGIIIHISTLSDTYRKLMLILVNKASLKLNQLINKILIWKNKLIEIILSWITSGVIGTAIETVFMWLNTFLATLNALKTAFNTAYGLAMSAISAISLVYGIPAESMGFLSGIYPRSMMNHPGKMLVELPIKTLNLKQSAFQNVNLDLIEKLITAAFPPITAPEYFISPEAFKIRLLVSDQNVAVIKPIITFIERISKMGAEFLPTYENLKFTNVWFLLAMILGWGPVTQSCYGALV